MPTDLDDLLRRELPLLLTAATASTNAVRRDVRVRSRRRQRRRRTLAGGVAAVAVAGAATATALAGRDAELSTASSAPEGAGGRLTFVEVQARGGVGGTAEVRLRFDGPLPDVPITRAPSVLPVDELRSPGIVVTSQPDHEVHVCGDVHGFPGDGPGSLDVLVPAAWLGNSTELYDPVDPAFSTLPAAPSDAGAAPAKVVWCGPYDGYVQVSVWGGEPADLGDVEVRLSADRTELIIVLD